jgi:hypothetical protein
MRAITGTPATERTPATATMFAKAGKVATEGMTQHLGSMLLIKSQSHHKILGEGCEEIQA